MSVLDQTILSEIQRLTLEGAGDSGATWPSGMWTQAEVLGYLNQRQNRWLQETGLLWTHALVTVTPGQANQATPTNWIQTVFLAFCNASGCFHELPRMDLLELDYGHGSWPGTAADDPIAYYDVDGSTNTTYVVPIPTAVVTRLEYFYVALGTTLTAAGVAFTVPDEFVPTIKYGCLAEMFGKLGEGQHAVLAQLCEERWQEGVELGKLYGAEGWLAG